MGKINNVIDDVISAIDKKSTLAEQEYFSTENVDEGLSKIERVFPQEVVDDYSLLKNVSEEDFNSLVESLYGTDEKLIKILKGAYSVIKIDIALFDSQVAKLNEFLSKVNESRRELELTSKRLDDLAESIRIYNGLKGSLGNVKEDGVLDISLIDSIVEALEFSEEDVSDYLDSAMLFNLERYSELGFGVKTTLDVGNDLISSDDALVVEEVNQDGETEKVKISEEELSDVFTKYGFDLSMLKPELVNALVNNGDLDNINGVFGAIAKNKLSYFLEGKKKSQLLTKFLLYSNKDVIDSVCSIFVANGIDKNYFGSYLPVFFPSNDRRKSDNSKRRMKGSHGDYPVVESESDFNLSVNGVYEDFVKNIEYINSRFNCNKIRLFERGATVLTMSHDRLLRNVEKFELYGYDLNGKFPLSALAGRRIMDSTDSFIEVGEGDYLRKIAPTKLTQECRGMARNIKAYQKAGISYRSERHYGTIKHSVTTNDKDAELSPYMIEQLVPDDVDKLLDGNKYYNLLTINNPRTISDETINSPIIRELEEKFKVSDDAYKFDDVLISRRKLLRNYEFLMSTDLVSLEEKENNSHDILLACALCNSFVGVEDLEKVDRGIGEAIGPKGGKHEIFKK